MKRVVFLVSMVVLMAVIMPSLAYGQDEPVVYNDPQMTARLDRVAFVVNLGVQIMQVQNPKYWQGRLKFRVCDEEVLNAYSYGDGRIFVSRGMMVATLGRDDKLISALNHEAMHVLQKHSRNQAKKNTVLGVLTLAAKAAFKLGDDSLVNTALQVGAAAGRARYSQKDEERADKGSVELCMLEGINLYAPASLMQDLQNKYGNTGGGFLAGHPATASRVKFLTDEAKKYTSVGQVGTVQAAPVLKPVFLGGVAVIVRDNAGGGGFWGGYSSLEEAVKTTFEDELQQTGRFTIVDQSSRDEAWQEQDLGDTGRMDPETVPQKGKTVGAKWFLYVPVNYFQITDEQNVNIGNWNANAQGHRIKVEIKGKVKLEPVERSILSYTTDFRGIETGFEVNASVSDWRRGVDVNWRKSPEGQAVESACQKAVSSLLGYIDSQVQPVTTTPVVVPQSSLGTITQPQPDPEKVTAFTLHIAPLPSEGKVEPITTTMNAPYGAVQSADYIQFLYRDNVGQNVIVAKINIKKVLGTEIWGAIEYPYLTQLDFGKVQFVRLMKSN
ncbi:MAG: M48 family metalloprotease [Patescibacteria group bacterium]|nr:M48 family metalloprotease [Patescibacteria group bacterium]